MITIKDIQLKEAKIFPDNRGEFTCRPIDPTWTQENISVSKKGVFRGIHLQVGENSQTKVVRVFKGTIIDYIIDLRQDSPTFLQVNSIQISGKEKSEIIIPAGCGHAFLALEEDTIMQYMVDKPYDPQNEVSINPESVAEIFSSINSYFNKEEIIISEKDQAGITLEDFKSQYL